jgi:hypothetical protein
MTPAISLPCSQQPTDSCPEAHESVYTVSDFPSRPILILYPPMSSQWSLFSSCIPTALPKGKIFRWCPQSVYMLRWKDKTFARLASYSGLALNNPCSYQLTRSICPFILAKISIFVTTRRFWFRFWVSTQKPCSRDVLCSTCLLEQLPCWQ